MELSYRKPIEVATAPPGMSLYRYDADLYAMQELAAEATRITGGLIPIHVGDIPLRLFNALQRRPPNSVARLRHDASGQLLAWIIAYGRHLSFDYKIHPDRFDSPLESKVLTEGIALARRESSLFERPTSGASACSSRTFASGRRSSGTASSSAGVTTTGANGAFPSRYRSRLSLNDSRSAPSPAVMMRRADRLSRVR